MNGWRVLLAATLLALPLWAAGAPRAHACSFAQRTLAEQVGVADLIVLASVEDVYRADPQPALPNMSRVEVESALAVEEYIKGSGPARLTVRTQTDLIVEPGAEPRILAGLTPSCGYAPQSDARYLAFISLRDDGRYTMHVLSPLITPESEPDVLNEIEQIRQILRDAAPGKFPDVGSAPASSSGPPRWPLAAAAAGGALLLLAPPLLALRRPR